MTEAERVEWAGELWAALYRLAVRCGWVWCGQCGVWLRRGEGCAHVSVGKVLEAV